MIRKEQYFVLQKFFNFLFFMSYLVIYLLDNYNNLSLFYFHCNVKNFNETFDHSIVRILFWKMKIVINKF